MTDYEQPEYVDRRVRFYDNQFLVARDMIAEQQYHIDRQRRLLRHLYTPGIVEGLEVQIRQQANDKLTLTVGRGTAIDAAGQQIVLADIQTLELTYSRETPILTIAYDEREAQTAEQGTGGSTRWHEMPTFELVGEGDTTLGKRRLALARLTRGQDANAPIVRDLNVRVHSGLRLRGPLSISSLADFRGGLKVSQGDVELKGELTVTSPAKLNKGLTVSGALTTLSQGLTVNGALTTLSQGLTVSGTATLSGNVTLSSASTTLTIDGSATFNGNVTVGTQSTTLTVNANTTSTKSLTVSELLRANKGAQLWAPTHNGGSNLAQPEIALALARNGVQYFSRENFVDFKISRYEQPIKVEDLTAARTQLDLVFAHGTDARESTTNVMTMRSNGNVGIGTTSPQSGLHISRPGNGTQGIRIDHYNASGVATGLYLFIGFEEGGAVIFYRGNTKTGKYGAGWYMGASGQIERNVVDPV